MKKLLPIAILSGLSLALNGLFIACRNGERADFPETAPSEPVQQTGRRQIGDTPLPVETKTQEEVVRLLSKTELVKRHSFPGSPLFVPGTPFSKIAFARYATLPTPDSETASSGVLWIDNATGEVVPKPGETWRPVPDAELIEMALSEFKDNARKSYLNGLRKEIEQVPGLAVVTFLCDPPHEEEGAYVAPPAFVLQIWINTQAKVVYYGEIGN